MKMSCVFAPTVKEAPKGVADQRMLRLIRGGFVSRLAAGQEALNLLPMGVLLFERTSCKVEEVLRAMAFQRVDFPDFCSHAKEVASGYVKSYRHLPLTFYQRERHSYRILGFAESSSQGEELIRGTCREFSRRLSNVGLPVREKASVSDGLDTLDLVVLTDKTSPYGERGYYCPKCAWCGDENSPVKEEVKPQDKEPRPLEVVDTPGADTIAELCRQLGVPPENTIKTMFYVAERQDGEKEVFVVLVRGDHKISEEKVKKVVGCRNVRFADPLEIKETVGDLAGYLGPVGLPERLRVIADRHVEGMVNAVVGANQPERHLMNACWGRDFSAKEVKDLIVYEKEVGCPVCSSALEAEFLLKVASFSMIATSSLGDRKISYQGRDGKVEEAHLWEGKIYMEPLVLSLVGPDGPLPAGVAPFDVAVIVPSVRNKEALELGEGLAESLEGKGFKVLLDDRDERAGVKFSDAELFGSPVTIVCGKGSADGVVELSYPDGAKEEVQVENLVEKVEGIFAGNK